MYSFSFCLLHTYVCSMISLLCSLAGKARLEPSVSIIEKGVQLQGLPQFRGCHWQTLLAHHVSLNVNLAALNRSMFYNGYIIRNVSNYKKIYLCTYVCVHLNNLNTISWTYN